MPAIQPIIRFENVAKTFPGSVTVLEGVNLAIQPGEFISIVGASGGGKTTLLELIFAGKKTHQAKNFLT